MTIFLNILFLLGLLVAVFTSFFGLPGNFIALGAVVVYAISTGWSVIGWKFLLLVGGLILLGELLEFLFGTFTSVRYGGSRWSAVGSFVGGVSGAIVGTGMIPLVGTVIGAFAGAFVLAFLFEFIYQRRQAEAARAGFGAFVGKMLGLSTKMSLGLAVVVLVALRLF
ncbi:MAG: DUF456 domain-containing protein [Candidatus Eisenbacteria sp.]|nr:DUF456 domain-containing protein [Candidatus Eisenbacteria bacterium]